MLWSYIAMMDSKDDEYEAQCTGFLTMLDSDSPAEANVAEVYMVDSEKHVRPEVNDIHLEPRSLSHHWDELAVNTAEANELHLPEEGIYEPPRLWERPPGHAAQGVDAFKVRCHVNSLHEPAVAVVGDSGAVPTPQRGMRPISCWCHALIMHWT